MTVHSVTKLTDSPAVVLAHYLRAQGGLLASAAFALQQPPRPDVCVTVYDVRAPIRGRNMRTGQVHAQYRVQVRARGTTKDECKAIMEAATTALDAVKRTVLTVGDASYMLHGCHQYGTVTTLAAPNSKREPEQTQEYVITITQGA